MSIFFYARWLEILISVFGVILMSVYLIIDTQMIVGSHSLKYSIDDYILASVNLYLDIINIFIYLLAIMGK